MPCTHKYVLTQRPYLRCELCGSHKATSPFPRENYLKDYWGHGVHSSLEDQRYNLEKFKNEAGITKIESALKYCHGKALLEIACAPGSLLKEATARGYYCEGVEPSKEYLKEVADYSECSINCGFFEDLKFRPKEFDNVIALDLFEHLEDSEGFVDRCHKILGSDGSLIIMSPMFFLDGEFEDRMFSPEHVFLPSQSYMQGLMSEYFQEVTFDRWCVGHEICVGRFPK